MLPERSWILRGEDREPAELRANSRVLRHELTRSWTGRLNSHAKRFVAQYPKEAKRYDFQVLSLFVEGLLRNGGDK